MPLFGFIGRLEEQKGVDTMLEAIPKLPEEVDCQVPPDLPRCEPPQPEVRRGLVEGTSYGLLIVAGLGVALVAAWAVVKELLLEPAEYRYFNEALEKVPPDLPRCQPPRSPGPPAPPPARALLAGARGGAVGGAVGGGRWARGRWAGPGPGGAPHLAAAVGEVRQLLGVHCVPDHFQEVFFGGFFWRVFFFCLWAPPLLLFERRVQHLQRGGDGGGRGEF